jgi:microcystin-dependent protein
MAGIKISQLDSVPGGTVASIDQLPVARGDSTFRISAGQFVVDGVNIGVGPGQFFSDKTAGAGTTLLFRTLSAEEGLNIRTSGNTMVISASGQNPTKTAFIGTGSRTTWTINDAKSINANNYRVTIDGVVQEPLADYTINGTNIVFGEAPPLSGNVVVVSNNLVRAFDVIPSDGSVTTNKLALSAVTTATINNGAITFEKLVATLQQALLPAGAVQPFAMNTSPAGWLAADGTEYSKTGIYAALFAAIGVTYGETNGAGGAGTSHFRVPDLRGYFVRGSGTNSDGTASGTFGTKQADDFKSHTHTISPTQVPLRSNDTDRGGSSSFFSVDNVSTLSVGETGGTETRPKNIAMLYCIKT